MLLFKFHTEILLENLASQEWIIQESPTASDQTTTPVPTIVPICNMQNNIIDQLSV